MWRICLDDEAAKAPESLDYGTTTVRQTASRSSHVQLTDGHKRERLASQGMVDDYVEFGIELAIHAPESASTVDDAVKRVTARPARTFQEWAHENKRLFRL